MPLVNYWAADLDRADSIELLQAQGPPREGDYASWMESARHAVKDDGIIKESLSASPDDHASAAAARSDKRKDISSK
ncbi:hypothetical protein DUNSADRAFT_15810 [Dunaliella salina]|uniref:Uncharacterized protein n=1 Tax=Dunaliella salina TaxID=3046 RepID=A0ABQ7H1H5_DUNSA|nr:hypothetical protein DUNSADRAFT_15810 [Dunaliella salina]|eukprot:KAF5840715.1 hypothetical protein DUNSADRAFT_15810 [Dunaliella salina]